MIKSRTWILIKKDGWLMCVLSVWEREEWGEREERERGEGERKETEGRERMDIDRDKRAASEKKTYSSPNLCSLAWNAVSFQVILFKPFY